MFSLGVFLTGFYKHFLEWVRSFFRIESYKLGDYHIFYYKIENNVYSVISRFDPAKVPDNLNGARRVYCILKTGKRVEITTQPGILYPEFSCDSLGCIYVELIDLTKGTKTVFVDDYDISRFLNGDEICEYAYTEKI
uniref:Uncharacterized protein n=1 Tax=Pithovirus LCPAC403 TaxID=2506596 RepID=A0A481ZEH6_9VIRU|nr:MAG: uncharacterized protein LCPAC403_01550 [Pithovirus LCPAC403]